MLKDAAAVTKGFPVLMCTLKFVVCYVEHTFNTGHTTENRDSGSLSE